VQLGYRYRSTVWACLLRQIKSLGCPALGTDWPGLNVFHVNPWIFLEHTLRLEHTSSEVENRNLTRRLPHLLFESEGEHFPASHRLFSSQTCSRSFQVGCSFI
jgi:hypothetical protein